MILDKTFPFILSWKPVLQGLKVTLLKTQSNASLARALCEALKIPNIEKIIKAIIQGMLNYFYYFI